MRNTAIAGKRLLEGLTGKELVALALQWQIDAVTQKPETFTMQELTAAIDRLSPHELREYNAWIPLLHLMESIHYEARISALHALWRLSLINNSLLDFRTENLEDLLQMRELIIGYVSNFYELEAGLRIIGEVMGCDLMPLVEYESDNLQGMIEIHNKCVAFADNVLMENAYCTGDVINENSQYFPELDTATMQPNNTVLAKIRDCIVSKRGREWYTNR